MIRDFITAARAVPLAKIKFDHPNLAPAPPLAGNVISPPFRGRFAAIKFPDPVQNKKNAIVTALTALEADMNTRFPNHARNKFSELMNTNKWAPIGGYAGSWQDGWKLALTPNNSEIGNELWRIHMVNALPACLKGSGIGYKLYSGFINYYGHACSSSNASAEAADVWNRLRKDPDFMFFASSLTGGTIIVITKRLAKPQVLELLNRFCGVRNRNYRADSFFQLVAQVSTTLNKRPQQWLDDDIYEMFQNELANIQVAAAPGAPATPTITPERADDAYRSVPSAAATIFHTTPQLLINVMAEWLSVNGSREFRNLSDINAKRRMLRTHYVLNRVGDMGTGVAEHITAVGNRSPVVDGGQIELYADGTTCRVKILNAATSVNITPAQLEDLVKNLGRLGFLQVTFDERYRLNGQAIPPQNSSGHAPAAPPTPLNQVPVIRGGRRGRPQRVRRLRTNNLVAAGPLRPILANRQFDTWTSTVGKTRAAAIEILQRRGGGPGALYNRFLDWFTAQPEDQRTTGRLGTHAMPANQFRRMLRDRGWRA